MLFLRLILHISQVVGAAHNFLSKCGAEETNNTKLDQTHVGSFSLPGKY